MQKHSLSYLVPGDKNILYLIKKKTHKTIFVKNKNI